jgi:GH25 family lysozyme M1 (1,4-beta-N-acetylmuramidase)
MDYVLGIDVYSLNSPDDSSNANNDPNLKAANWKAVSDAGVRFAYMKATEFRADAGYAERMQCAKDAGLLRGAYMLPHFELDTVADQVKMFVQTVGADQGELPPMLDLESPGGNWPRGKLLFKRVKDCLDRLTQAFGRKPIIYTSQSIVRDFQIINPPWGKDYDLWVASYPYADFVNKLQYSDPNNPPQWSSKYPPQPDGYKPWIIWQWTEKGRLNGMGHENVDINSFKGTYNDLLKWANAKAPIPVTPSPSGQPEPAPVQPPVPQPVVDPVNPPPQPAPVEENFILYTVKPDDALGLIAERNHTTIEKIMALNPQIKNRNIIVDGWVLKIPTS